MMTTYSQPNLVCPTDDCHHQFQKIELLNQNRDSFNTFSNNLECPSCGTDIHADDAVIEYFRQIDTSEAALHSLAVGGWCLQGTISVEVGTTREKTIHQRTRHTTHVNCQMIASSTTSANYETGLARVWDADNEDFEDRLCDTVEPIIGPRLVDNESVVVNVIPASGNGSVKIGFLSSKRKNTNLDEIPIGYHISLFISDIQGPPWIELLREGIKTLYEGSGRAPYSTFISAFDNFILRQMYRTAKAHGWSDEKFNNFIDDMWGWEDWVKDGLEELVGDRLTTRNIQKYQSVYQVRDKRNIDIIHVSYDDNIPAISLSEASDDFVTILDTMIEVYEMCHETRATL